MACSPDFSGEFERSITDGEFSLFQRLIQQESGIRLNGSKKALLIGRLSSRVRQLELPTFHQYYRRVREDDAERRVMIDLITTNETQFFREPRQFALLENSLVPAWKRAAEAGARPRHLRVWSAGCSTGEEPYSIAMVLDALCEGWSIEIIATDISTRALRAAAAGVWPREKARHIPPRYLRRYLLEGFGSQEGKVRAADAIRRHIRFFHMNLHEPPGDLGGPFDLVLCRNVMIYFDHDTRAVLVDRLIEHCARGGYLFLGHAETLQDSRARMRPVETTVWVRR